MRSNTYTIITEQLDQKKEMERYKKSCDVYAHQLGRRFYENGINVCTGTLYDPEGYDLEGYNQEGFSNPCDGVIHKVTKTAFNPEGYGIDGYNIEGFNKDRIHKITKTKYDPEGYDFDGYNAENWDRNNINKLTGTKYNLEGYNRSGFSKDKNKKINIITNTEYDLEGYNREGYDKNNFDRNRINKETGTKYNPEGYNYEGYNKEGYNKDGYNKDDYNIRGFNRDKNIKINCITKTIYDVRGFDNNDINKYTGTKYDQEGFDVNEIHKDTGTRYNPEGYNIYGRNRRGLSKEDNQKLNTNYHMLTKNVRDLINGDLLIERYKMVSKYSIDELYSFAKKDGFDYTDLNKINSLRNIYNATKQRTEPFEFFKNTRFSFNNKEISLKPEEITKLLEFLKNNNLYVCDYTLRKYAKLYIKGKIDLNMNYEMNEIIDIINTDKIDAEKEKQRKEKANKLLQRALALKNQERK